MFCPKCAAQNIDGASFCRVCGANISLVPQALAGQPLTVRDDNNRAARRSRRRGSREASIEHSMKNVFVGIAFLIVALALSWSGRGGWWWIWLLIPAFSCLGQGVAEYIRFKEETREPQPLKGYAQPTMTPTINEAPVRPPLPARNTGELIAPPPSVTEGTTRHLGAEAPTRHLDNESDYRS
ncbi:MAG TPA: zinc ribbon domain-containing protein [Pyrinomonadaceae bacterium]|nr:zinc ribbon domain-containing protein [Pyrinomonadaceae bacterium]